VQARQMKKISLVAFLLLAACASSNIRTSDSDPRLAQFEKERRAIAESEKQCIDESMTRSRNEMARVTATPEASVESQTQKESYKRDREISQCRVTANNEDAKISEQERKEYELQAQEERDRASLLAILTTSRHP
jgi:hypothetical protein